MKSLKECINESIKETSKYKKSQFDKDVNNFEKILNNKNKLNNFLEEQGLEDDDDAITVLNEFIGYMGSSENMAEEDDDELSYEDIVNRAPEWLENNIMDEHNIDEDSLPMYIGAAIELWNSISKHKIDY